MHSSVLGSKSPNIVECMKLIIPLRRSHQGRYSKASVSVIRIVSKSSSRVASWQFTPGTSSIQPIYQPASCVATAVYVCWLSVNVFKSCIFGAWPRLGLSDSSRYP